MRDDATQRTDCGFKLLKRRRVFLRCDQIDFLRQLFNGSVEANQAFGWFEIAQRSRISFSPRSRSVMAVVSTPNCRL